MTEAWASPAGLGLLGLVLGSFIATLAIRWPEGRSVAHGRSRCDQCGKALGPAELVPMLSYAVQRGRCRRCGGRIALSHPIVEGLGLAIGVAAGLVAPGMEGVAGAAFGWLLLAAGALDWTAFWLPDRLTGALALAGLATGWAGLPPALIERALGGIAGLASLWLLAALYRRWRGREGLGGGDAKLFGAIGLWLGWRALPLVLLAASVAGLLAALAMRLTGREVRADTRLPLGVFLAGAAYAVWLGAMR